MTIFIKSNSTHNIENKEDLAPPISLLTINT